MDLSEIINISGKGGLFKIISQTKNGVIVESLVDQKRFPTFASHDISTLNDISVFTTNEDVPLKEVLKKIHEKEKGGAAIDHKSKSEELASYFESILPDYDKERVYNSDIKKLIQWYNLLQKQNILNFDEEEEKKEEVEKEEKIENATDKE